MKLSFADAAEQIIRENKKAMSYTEITRIAQQRKLIHSEAEDPAVSLYVTLRDEIKRKDERNEPQRFIFQGNGFFTLLEIVSAPLPSKTKSALEEVQESRKEACKSLLNLLTKTNHGKEFEAMVADLLIAMGYDNVTVVGGSDDQGVDITCEKSDGLTVERIAIQCKCKKLANQIGPKDISTLRDNLSTYGCRKGILITTTVLNDKAKEKAAEPGKDTIHYIENAKLFDLFAEHQIGLKSETLKYFRIASEQYAFLKESKATK